MVNVCFSRSYRRRASWLHSSPLDVKNIFVKGTVPRERRARQLGHCGDCHLKRDAGMLFVFFSFHIGHRDRPRPDSWARVVNVDVLHQNEFVEPFWFFSCVFNTHVFSCVFSVFLCLPFSPFRHFQLFTFHLSHATSRCDLHLYFYVKLTSTHRGPLARRHLVRCHLVSRCLTLPCWPWCALL